MKIRLYILIGCMAVIGCSKQIETDQSSRNQPIRVQNGISVYQLRCEGFADLPQQQKLYAYHLIQACKFGESLIFEKVIAELEQAFIYAPISARDPISELIRQLSSGSSDLTHYRTLWLNDTSSQVSYHMDLSFSDGRMDTLFTGFVAIKDSDNQSGFSHQLLYAIDPTCTQTITVLISDDENARRFRFSNVPPNPTDEPRIFLMPTIELHKNRMGGITRIELKE